VFSLSNKVAFITGGASGIGLAVARRYLEAGAIVFTGDVMATHAEGVARHFHLDVSDEEQVRNAMESIAEEHGGLDIVVNNAGIVANENWFKIADGTTENLDKIFRVNTYGVFYGLKYASKLVNSGGSIINTSSRASTLGVPGNSQYSATKSAVDSLTRVAALELAPKGIRVNAVCPSFIATDMGGSEYGDAMAKTLTPLGRLGRLDDLVGVYHFLAADESAYLSGQALNVDGGWSAGVSEQLSAQFTS